MKIIGHRGAAGLALENTLPSIEVARILGVDAIEFDVRKTKDNKLVLCHDGDVSDISESSAKLKHSRLKELKRILLDDKQSTIPSVQEALKIAGGTPVIIELKEVDTAELLIPILKKYSKLDITVASFKLGELAKLRQANVKAKLFGLEHTKPFEIVQYARELKLDGIGLNFWILNPLTYWMCKRAGLNIYVFTVNSRLVGRFLGMLYPDVSVCTDHPEWFIKHPYLRLKAERSWTTDSASLKARAKKRRNRRR